MRELSLHILDIVQNSITAQADLIQINIAEDVNKDILTIIIKDNGKGMNDKTLKSVCSPFVTTRTTRKIGLGIPLFKAAAERCGGGFEIASVLGKGTEVKAWFVHSHIDRAPIGDIAGTLFMLVSTNPEIDFDYIHNFNDKCFEFDTREIRKAIGGLSINCTEVILWIKEYLEEGIKSLYGGGQ